MKKIAFDYKKYLKIQSEHIKERINQFDNKLYIEFGGKLFDDYHASRVLPGFRPDSKIKMLSSLKDETEFIIATNAQDLISNKIRNDNGLTYSLEVLKLIKEFKDYGITKGSVVITRYISYPTIDEFIIRLTNMGYPVYKHYEIDGYPYNTDFILSDEGFGKNEFVITEKPLVFVTAPGPGSGKMATCLSQLYHEFKRGIKAGYAKYETFPVWNLPINHPVNLAYEAATVDLKDINMIDSYHFQAYGTTAVNYNRDLEVFPVVKTIFEKIYGKSPYESPTDMGVNMVGFCISDDEAACEAAKQEIIRRYFEAKVRVKIGKFKPQTLDKLSVIMKQLNIDSSMRKCVNAANKCALSTKKKSFAIELNDGRIVTGKESRILSAPAACFLNAVKALAHIDQKLLLLSPTVLNPIIELKKNKFDKTDSCLHVNEVLIVLAVSKATNPMAEAALDAVKELKGSQGHSTVIVNPQDLSYLTKMGIDVTMDDVIE